MSLYMPPALQWLGYVAGSAWPQGDEDQMWALGRDWHSAHDQLQEPISEMQRIIAQAGQAYGAGAGRDAVIAALTKITQGDGSLTDLAKLLDEMGDAADGMGTEIQYVKIMIITSLADLAVEIMLAWVFPPTAPATEAAAIAGTRAVLRVVYDRSIGAIERLLGRVLGKVFGKFGETLSRFLVRHVAMSTFLGTAQDLLIQAGQVGAGHRKGIDGTQLAITAISSAAAGAAGGLPIADLTGKGIVKGIGKFTDHFHLPEITDLLTKKDLTTPELSFARPSLSGMFHGDFSATVTQTIRPRSTRAFVEGAVSGGVSGMAGAMAGYVAGTGAYSAITGTNFGQNLSSNWGFQPLSSGATAGAIAGGAKGEINFGGKLRLDQFNDGAAFRPADDIPLNDLTHRPGHDDPQAPQAQPQTTTDQPASQQPRPRPQLTPQPRSRFTTEQSAPQVMSPHQDAPQQSQHQPDISQQSQLRTLPATEQSAPQATSSQQSVPRQFEQSSSVPQPHQRDVPSSGRAPQVELPAHVQAQVDHNTSDFSGELDRAFGLGPGAAQHDATVHTEPHSPGQFEIAPQSPPRVTTEHTVPHQMSPPQNTPRPREQSSPVNQPQQRGNPQRQPPSGTAARVELPAHVPPQSPPRPPQNPAPRTGVPTRPTPSPPPPQDEPIATPKPTPWPTGWELPNTPRFFPAPADIPFQPASAPSPDFWLDPSDWSRGATGPSDGASGPDGA
ncbi:hypothetical protein ABIA39_007308 [Nocardia sp. GAS34]|uniref:WXG100-like domain-containing protein n=1 Tax=unclassified Nocardia TaxID=2637762 RepID=UPI003D1F579D